MGMGVDAIEEEVETKKLTDALKDTELDGGVRLNLTEEHLVRLGTEIQQEVKEAGLALVDEVQEMIDSFSSLTMQNVQQVGLVSWINLLPRWMICPINW